MAVIPVASKVGSKNSNRIALITKKNHKLMKVIKIQLKLWESIMTTLTHNRYEENKKCIQNV